MFTRTEKFRMVAQTLFGLEELLANELRSLGAEDIEVFNRAVSFTGNKGLMYKANYRLRLALRVLVPVGNFVARTEQALYNGVKDMPWEKYMSADNTLAVSSSINSEHFNHANYVALKTKDAIADYFRDKWNKRPSVDRNRPDVQVYVHIHKQDCTVMLDSSGDSLHKRGYRVAQGHAPLNEVLAAGLIMLSEWDGQQTLVDPMCGSGTLLTEAALIAQQKAPGTFRRRFGFMGWPDYEAELWKDVKDEAQAQERFATCALKGFDIDIAAVNYSRKNVQAIHADKLISIERADFFDSPAPASEGMLIINPPYDERLPLGDAQGFYKQIGDTMKKSYQGYTAWIFSANKEALKSLGLQTSKRLTLYNGPHECKFHRYELYAGSRKAKD